MPARRLDARRKLEGPLVSIDRTLSEVPRGVSGPVDATSPGEYLKRAVNAVGPVTAVRPG
ncbi:hypothetical protein [Streptomyces tubercidicus]|uniref:Uncharacterized protein n=1 Tax=Streptomyces tubercidicus TaxID=47759 RepID=A0A640UJN0_9ACTN|nr:hypothetical protein [Streptomyces tubercidicus]WAU10427.1 hypothetical protein STRTU_000508 [Streptomyces tubercidicus]GFE35522.1 hypothetical protein Stube_01950 [Streptomyces tubercidicus]